jgi:hypothetical protein
MSARLIVIALLVAGTAGSARAAEAFGIELELCIQAARDADENCAKLTDDPNQRLQCFQKARGSQLDCLEHALADAPAGNITSEDHTGTALPEPPAATGSTAAVSPAAPSEESPQASTQKPSREKAPDSTEPRGTQGNREANSPEPAGGGAVPKESTTEPAKEPASTAQVTPEAVPSPLPSAKPAAEAATAAVQPDAPKKDDARPDGKPDGNARSAGLQAKPLESRWVVSETASPVDYSPLLTAVIRPTSGSPGGPVSLAIRCRGGQTALLIRTERIWHPTRRNAIPVDFQINDQSMVRQNWTLSADGKIASYSDDPVELLKSLPEGARLTFKVTDGAEQAIFVLAGWDAIRKRAETACKWPKTTDEASSGKR